MQINVGGRELCAIFVGLICWMFICEFIVNEYEQFYGTEYTVETSPMCALFEGCSLNVESFLKNEDVRSIMITALFVGKMLEMLDITVKFEFSSAEEGESVFADFNRDLRDVRRSVELKASSMKKIIADFRTKIRSIVYLGVSNIDIPNVHAMRYPIDFFMSRLYRMKFLKEYEESREKYRRVNPTLAMKLAQLLRYDNEFLLESNVAEALKESVEEVLEEVFSNPSFEEVKIELNGRLNSGMAMFDDINVNGSSAAGYPYPAGVKRRDVLEEAKASAYDLYNDSDLFEGYMSDHRWYTTGRAKLVKMGKPDKARLVLYSGFSYSLLGFVYSQVWTGFMNRQCRGWSAVGMSWMNGGAAKVASFFEDCFGIAVSGFEYMTLDVAEWDSSVCRELLHACKRFHMRVLERTLSPENARYKEYFGRIYDEMIEAKVVLPGGHSFRLHHGMKSGWIMTANDNTLMHEFVVRTLQKIGQIPDMKRQLYGDDNLSRKPIGMSKQLLVDGYGMFGFRLSHIHVSRRLSEVDFLSKFIIFKDGFYFPWREQTETHARLLMPEEFDPNYRIVPDSRVAAEHLLGHLLDNPFNANVRHVCFTLLEYIKSNYGVRTINVEEFINTRWSFMLRDIKRLCGEIPTVPSVEFIQELYGVFSEPVSFNWAGVGEYARKLPKFSFISKAPSAEPFFRSQKAAFELSVSEKFGHRKTSALNRACGYKKMPLHIFGQAGGKLIEIINTCGLKCESVLDLGTHPGAAMATLQSMHKVKSATCVSLFPEIDKSKGFCPRVLRGKDFEFFEMSAEKFKPTKHYDMCFDDIYDFEEADRFKRAEQMFGHVDRHFAGALTRAEKFKPFCGSYVMKVRGFTPLVLKGLYDLYRMWGYLDIRKTFYSNPWNPEFYVVLVKRHDQYVRRSTFNGAVNAYLNGIAPRLSFFVNARAFNYDRMSLGRETLNNPLRDDETVQRAFDAYAETLRAQSFNDDYPTEVMF
ncbi:hypothetical protein [Phytophthora infestans RNA virus 1]|uniref:hypothetical protein n=1 Tax=Phytophthora infestans RNA virus 1 TaxID=640897 RepID=UPI0001B5DB00|nr:hypothetical protein [Phytophthora infestans RNA virus 1]ACQ91602.1 unknown [Phytophthora infestans RNA virus 1]